MVSIEMTAASLRVMLLFMLREFSYLQHRVEILEHSRSFFYGKKLGHELLFPLLNKNGLQRGYFDFPKNFHDDRYHHHHDYRNTVELASAIQRNWQQS